MFEQASVLLVTGKPFQPSLTFLRNAGAYPSGAPKSYTLE